MMTDGLSKPRTFALPQSSEFELRWQWVRTELNAILGGTRHFAAMGQHPAPDVNVPMSSSARTEDETVDPDKVLQLDVEFVVRLAPDGTVESVIGSPRVPGLTPELLVQAMRGQGMAVRLMSAFEAVTLAWEDNTSREPWVDLVESALDVMVESVRAGDALTLGRVLDSKLPEASGAPFHHPL